MAKNEKTRAVAGRLARAGGWQIVKHISKSVPFVGTVFAVGLAGRSIRRKGFVRGALDVGLDLTPIVGTIKNAVEVVTGDLIPDKVIIKKRSLK